jgi:hypothetical protein
VVAKVDLTLPEAFEGDAHELLMLTYRDQRLPLLVRLDAAKAAMPFEKARLAPQEAKQPEAVLPLAERLKAYAMEDAVANGAGKVVALRK